MSVEENKSEEKGIKMIVFGRKIDFLSLFCEKIINFVRAYNVAKCNIANIQNKQQTTLQVSRKALPLQRVFHGIRFKVN